MGNIPNGTTFSLGLMMMSLSVPVFLYGKTEREKDIALLLIGSSIGMLANSMVKKEGRDCVGRS